MLLPDRVWPRQATYHLFIASDVRLRLIQEVFTRVTVVESLECALSTANFGGLWILDVCLVWQGVVIRGYHMCRYLAVLPEAFQDTGQHVSNTLSARFHGHARGAAPPCRGGCGNGMVPSHASDEGFVPDKPALLPLLLTERTATSPRRFRFIRGWSGYGLIIEVGVSSLRMICTLLVYTLSRSRIPGPHLH